MHFTDIKAGTLMSRKARHGVLFICLFMYVCVYLQSALLLGAFLFLELHPLVQCSCTDNWDRDKPVKPVR